MRTTRARFGIGIASIVAVATGCTGILGDFDVAGGPASGDDGGPGTDGTIPTTDGNVPGNDGSNPHDGGGDGAPGDGGGLDAADAGNFLLTCDGFRFNSPIVVDSLDAQQSAPTFPNPPQIVSVSQDKVEILEAGHDGTYTLYWVDKHNNAPNQVDGVYSQQFNNTQTLGPFKRVTGGSAIPQTVFTPPLAGQTYQFIDVPDTLLPGNAPDQYYGLSPFRGIVNNNGFSADFFEMAPLSEYFYAYTAVPQDGGPPDGGAFLYAGHTVVDGGITQEIVSRATYHGGTPMMLHVGTSVRIFYSSSPDQGGALVYRTSDQATGLDGGEPGRPLSATLPALMIGVGVGDTAASSSAGYNLAMAEFNPNGTPLATLHAGSVTGAQLDTFTVTDLPAGPAFNDTSEVPIGGSDAKWEGNEFAIVGLGSPAPANGGANFVAMDAQGHTRAVHVGTNAVLQGHHVDAVGLSLAQRLGTRYVTWNLTWTETFHSSDGGPDFQRLFLNELICH